MVICSSILCWNYEKMQQSDPEDLLSTPTDPTNREGDNGIHDPIGLYKLEGSGQ